MTATEKQYWAGEFTDAELDAAADAGCMGMSHAYSIPNPRRKSVPTVTPEEMKAALERARQSAVLEFARLEFPTQDYHARLKASDPLEILNLYR
jgi:hypothetical protein